MSVIPGYGTERMFFRNNHIKTAVPPSAPTGPSDDGACTAIHYAARYGNALMLRYLIEMGGDVNVRDDETHNYTPLHYALLSFADGNKSYLDVVKYLLEEGAIINAVGGLYVLETPYEIAKKRGLSDIVVMMDEIGKTGDEYINYMRSEK